MKRIYIIIATIAAIAISAVNAYGEELTAKADAYQLVTNQEENILD